MNSGPLISGSISGGSGGVSEARPSSSRAWSAPVLQRATTSAISSALAAVTSTRGHRHGSNTRGSPRMHSAAWMQNDGSQVTSTASVA